MALALIPDVASQEGHWAEQPALGLNGHSIPLSEGHERDFIAKMFLSSSFVLFKMYFHFTSTPKAQGWYACCFGGRGL